MTTNPLLENPDYETLEVLGSGSFGYVVLAWNKRTKQKVAVKCLRRLDVTKYVEAEVINHSLLRHPHVIQFKEVSLTSTHICIAMEYASGGTLFHYVQKRGRLREAVARWFFQQLVLGVDYCHSRGVANRDIKLENTLLHVVDGLPLPLVKICDFGYSKADFKSAAKSQVGTLKYMAPEVLLPPRQGGKYDGKVADIWSCGVMLYVMLCGRYPFDAPLPATAEVAAAAAAAGRPGAGGDALPDRHPLRIMHMLQQMVGQRYHQPTGASAPCCDLLHRMLLPSPTSRITLEEILAHPWFTVNLPPEAAGMNAVFLQRPPKPETLAHVISVMDEARGRPPRRPRSEAASDSDDGMDMDGSDSLTNFVTEAIAQHFSPGQAPTDLMRHVMGAT